LGTASALLAILAVAAALALLGPLAGHPALSIGLYGLCGAAWLAALALARRAPLALGWVLLGAIALRAIALASDLSTSDDLWRVVWEGEVVLRGLDPYTLPPADPRLAGLAAELSTLHARVGHPEVPAAYPPLAQGLGALGAAVGAGDPERAALFLRAALALLDLALLFPLLALLRRRGLPDGLLVAWAWCPLAAFEIAGAGHLEGLALPLLVGALALSERASSAVGLDERAAGRKGELGPSALFAGAVAAKLLPIVLLPWFAREGNPARRVALVLAVLALSALPIALLQGGPLAGAGGLGEYALRWESASFAHRFVEGALALGFERDLSWSDPRRLSRALLALVFAAWAVRTWRRERSAVCAAGALLGAWLVLSPTFHPWYALWAVPWLALRPAPAFAWLAAAAPLAFAPVARWQASGAWHEPAWLWPVLFVPFAGLLLHGAPRARHALRA
jgi:hypothetical protein